MGKYRCSPASRRRAETTQPGLRAADEEAYWDEFFNGYKASNPWAEFVPPEHLTERVPIELGDDEERIRVVFHNGSELLLDREGDLGDGNAGLLVFVDGQEQPVYVPWSAVRRLDFHAPSKV